MKTAIPEWLIVAMQEIGEAEIEGPDANPRIAEYLEIVGQSKDDEIPWCSAFANWIMARSGITPTLSAAARSWEGWGVRLDAFKMGCVAVFKRGKEAWMGHVGFAMGELGDNVLLLGGNQGNQVKIALYPKKDLLGYRWPKNSGEVRIW